MATAAGGVLGALMGNQIGTALDERDELLARESLFQSMNQSVYGTQSSWNNNQTGNYGNVVTSDLYRVNNNNCRDYTSTIFVDGRAETARGVACQNPDGTWSIQK